MQLEARQVLAPRNVIGLLLREWRSKEWWYTGVYDPRSGVYVSWYVVRVAFIDQIALTVFDPAHGAPQRYERKLWLARPDTRDRLDLTWSGKDGDFRYASAGDDGWRFELKAGGFDAAVDIAPRTPAFTKFDNPIVERYGMLHYFHAIASGSVQTPAKRYDLDGALVYRDHSFGRVPRRTGWHWLAVQNERVALSCLVNYGPYAQRYTQAWIAGAGPRPAEWVRLEQSVSFECPGTTPTCAWRVTSSDLDLDVEMIQRTTGRTLIPPLFGWLVNLTHTEAFVIARGRIRIDGTWVEVDGLGGALEEHFGTW